MAEGKGEVMVNINPRVDVQQIQDAQRMREAIDRNIALHVELSKWKALCGEMAKALTDTLNCVGKENDVTKILSDYSKLAKGTR